MEGDKGLRIAIVTDSTAYFTESERELCTPTIVPLTISIGDKHFKEGTTFSNDEFYGFIRRSDEFPASSQPAVGEFAVVYRKLLESYDEIISIHLSGGLSGTIQAARTASEIVDNQNRITVIDSLSAAQGITEMVIQASKMAQEGSSSSEICKRIDYMIKHTQIYFLIDTLDYLHKGGRIGGASALFGNLLQIKPILFVKNGKVEILEKIRTEKKAVQYFIELIANTIGETDGKLLRVNICHADNYLKAVELKDLMAQKMPGQKVDIGELGPVIGMHVGPGTCGAIISLLD